MLHKAIGRADPSLKAVLPSLDFGAIEMWLVTSEDLIKLPRIRAAALPSTISSQHSDRTFSNVAVMSLGGQKPGRLRSADRYYDVLRTSYVGAVAARRHRRLGGGERVG